VRDTEAHLLSTRFAGLLGEHQRILFKVANGYCRDRGDRADLVQEMAAQAWRGFARFDGSVKFSTWLYRVALNVAISFYRSEHRRIRDALPLEGLTVELPAPEPQGESENLTRLRQLIAQLDPVNRALITLYLDGNSHAEIAEIVGLSVSNVGTRINRLKERLKQKLEVGDVDR
jgi:RNA polymerase sigma factor (sigma-70 family)